jgi:hypothetical protein
MVMMWEELDWQDEVFNFLQGWINVNGGAERFPCKPV